MFDLPQEFIDRFIDEFHDSNKDLKALSLDFTAMREHYDDVKYKASLPSTKDPDFRLTLQDENFLRSPLAGNPQSTQAFLSSIANTLPDVRGLRLLSFVQVGNKLMPARNYLQDWLGYGGDECASHSRLAWQSLSYEDFLQRRKARWDSLDLPWGIVSSIYSSSGFNIICIRMFFRRIGYELQVVTTARLYSGASLSPDTAYSSSQDPQRIQNLDHGTESRIASGQSELRAGAGARSRR
ncbi:hypothetical protein FB446DRAFT_790759 [Lentinula raphanica]|nr:hypothetical protein FB446DRAFT_790759 [Lentinula raphanica]